MRMGGTCGVTRGGGPQRVILLCLVVCIHMQYIIHGLYFFCINVKKDRPLFHLYHACHAYAALRHAHCVILRSSVDQG